MRVFLYTSFALIAFAFNSILCRLALRGQEADAAGFTVVRLASGAIALIVISYFFSKRKGSIKSGSWSSAFFLFAYAVCFSFAYLGLTAGTGALILFGTVQMTMVAAAVVNGERPTPLEWIGLAVAVGGLVYLVFPGLASPPLTSSVLMAAAGMSWGFYSIRGRSSGDPLANTAANFVRSLPMTVILAVICLPQVHLTPQGWLLAILSGAVTSGVGYTAWYSAVKQLAATRAAILQLTVPVIAAAIGVVILGETATPTLFLAAAMIVGGILVTIFGKRRPRVAKG